MKVRKRRGEQLEQSLDRDTEFKALAQFPHMAPRCSQCGKVLGPEYFLGPVCGACCRANHKRVVGRR